jgi:hypothetical protein
MGKQRVLHGAGGQAGTIVEGEQLVPFGGGGDMPAGRAQALGAFSGGVLHELIPLVEY